MACNSCGKELEVESLYCVECGTQQNAITAPIQEHKALVSSVVPATPVTPPSLSQAELDTLHARLTHANLSRMRKQWEEAIEDCVLVLQKQPGNATAHSLLGDIYAEQGKIDDAIQWYRMAIELKPNASDGMKLHRLEAERSRLLTQGVRNGGAAFLTGDGTAMVGTTNLVGGVSPRRWLNVLTGVSLCFVGVTVLGLLAVQTRRSGQTDKIATPRIGTGLADNVPAPPPLSPSFSSAQSGSATQGTIGGGGFRADSPVRSQTTTPAPKTAPVNDGSHSSPAPVNPLASSAYRTTPLSPNTTPTPTSGDKSGGFSGTPVSQNTGDVTQLSGGMYIASIIPNSGTAEITINSTQWQNNEPGKRLAALNVLRAARTVFAADATVSRASVSVVIENAGAGKTTIVQAEVNRAAIHNVALDGLFLSQVNQFASFHWFLETPSLESADQKGANEAGQ
ncbi:MAG: tetratricopeptide repeat protein [Chthonomonadaceae bacterium]|nr:tetratricopeptide repeat protein [Chthonomonadaceae bacterium]